MKRICYKCKIEKTLEEFFCDRGNPLGKRYDCKLCSYQASKDWIHRNPERHRANKKASNIRNIKSSLLRRARQRAKKKNIEFDLHLDDINIPERCPVLNILLRKNNTRQSDDSPSIDRINSNKGYIKDNIVIMSFRANRIKNNATIEELQLIYKWWKNYDQNN